MGLFENVLNNIKFPVIVWRGDSLDETTCIFSNCYSSITKGIKLIDYINDHNDIKNIYNDVQIDDITIKQGNYSTIFSKIDDTIFSEIHYPECNSGYLLYSISNKIRNPLQNIIGMLLLIDNTNFTDKQYKFLNIIKKSSYEIVSIVNDIIDIDNLEKNKIKLSFEDVSLKKITDTIQGIVLSEIERKKLVMTCNVNNKLPHIISVDKPRLEQIIVNIVGNAIKHTDNGVIELDISIFKNNPIKYNCPFLYVLPKDDEYNILFKIKDTGRGIDDNQKKIINKILGIDKYFYTMTYKNYGFGLMISNYLCKLMNGHIWYKSEIDIGSIFYINIICKGIFVDLE
jgi:signal transduction histidine kinase